MGVLSGVRVLAHLASLVARECEADQAASTATQGKCTHILFRNVTTSPSVHPRGALVGATPRVPSLRLDAAVCEQRSRAPARSVPRARVRLYALALRDALYLTAGWPQAQRRVPSVSTRSNSSRAKKRSRRLGISTLAVHRHLRMLSTA